MDHIKDWIASEMQSSATMFERRGIPEHDGEVTVTKSSKLTTTIRVQTFQGPRYFEVIVKERY